MQKTCHLKMASSMRLCRHMANWTPAGFIGQLFKTLGKHITPPAGVQSQALWGTEAWIEENFGPLQLRFPLSPTISSSATGRRSILSTSSALFTDQCTRPFLRWMRISRRL
jgi:hypothetical protein